MPFKVIYSFCYISMFCFEIVRSKESFVASMVSSEIMKRIVMSGWPL